LLEHLQLFFRTHIYIYK